MVGPVLHDPNDQLSLLNPALIKSILVIRLDALGDFILFSPFLKNLRTGFPDAKITLLTAAASRNLAETCPVVDHILYLPKDALQNQDSLNQTAHAMHTDAGAPYHLAIVPRWDIDYYAAGVLAAASGAPIRYGYDAACNSRKHHVSAAFDDHYTLLAHDTQNRHDVERNLLLLNLIGVATPDTSLAIWTNHDDENTVSALQNQHNIKPKNYYAIGTGASLSLKIWPTPQYFELLQRLLADDDKPIMLLGAGDSDAETAAFLSGLLGDRVIDCTNQLSPRQTALMCRDAYLFIGADSFAKHCAAAFKTPIIEISCHPKDGLDSNQYHVSRFGAWQCDYRFVQPDSCGAPVPADFFNDPMAEHPHCIERVGVDAVWQAIIDIRATLPPI